MIVDLSPFMTHPTWEGFGINSLAAANQAGISNAQIKEALAGSGITIGEKAGAHLGANTDLYKYQVKGGFGANSLAAAQAAGMTNNEIRSSLASSGLRIGEKAAATLNVNPGRTYLGIAPGVAGSHAGNSGNQYASRPNLAPAGYGFNMGLGDAQGYSPTLYISGGSSSYEPMNYIFGLDYQGGPDIGDGYRDPNFHRDNAAAAPAVNNNYYPYGSGGGSFEDIAMQALQAVLKSYNMPASSNRASAPAPQQSFGSVGTTSNMASGVRAAGSPGSGNTYNSMNRSGFTGITTSGLNIN